MGKKQVAEKFDDSDVDKIPKGVYKDAEGELRLPNGDYLPDGCYRADDGFLVVERDFWNQLVSNHVEEDED